MDPSGAFELGIGSGLVATTIMALGTGAVFAAANRSIFYGTVTGFLGAAGLAYGFSTGRLPKVLSEGVWAAGIATLIVAGWDLGTAGNTSWLTVLSQNKWKYASLALEAFSWGAFGEGFLGLLTEGADVFKSSVANTALELGTQKVLSVGLQMAAGATTLVEAAIFAAGDADQKRQAREMVKDFVSKMVSSFISFAPSLLLETALASRVPGIRWLPAGFTQELVKKLGSVPAKAVESVSDLVADNVVKALHIMSTILTPNKLFQEDNASQ